ncbi:unnamed protein product [Urochloa humidicola]
MAPEYLCNSIITTKADIYSLGVIIIEMITGRRMSAFDVVTTWRDFMEPVLENWRNRLKVAARCTSLEIECEQIKSSLEIGLSCIKINRIERPTTVEIMESLTRWESTNCYVSDEEKPSADKILDRDNEMKKFQEVIAQLEHALFDFPYEKLDGSDEVREQVELVHAQLKRTKERVKMPDDELCDDMLSNKSYSPSTELDIPKRLSEKLHLTTITQEWLALHEMVASGCGQDPGEHIEKMSILLKKIENSVQTENLDTGPPIASSKLMDSNGDPRPVIIPDQFRCPISLELMTDPVVVVTGQTYERAYIEEWLASGHRICPATQQRLTSTKLTPNYILRSLIVQWCKTNRIEPPKRSLSESANIDVLISQLCSPDTEQQRSAAAELRHLAKCSANNRICIAESGAIPLLLSLLSSSDLQTQEHAVTALLNLSIHADNKAIIVSSGAVPSIVDILKNGSMEARENAAATIFSLSVFNEYKVTIGETGAIPALVVLLSQGSQQARKDAAAALFNLCIYQGNKGRAIRAGLVPIVMELLANPTRGLMDEAMAILSILSSHPEGKVAIWAAEPVPVLVEMIGSGSPRNRENAAAVMLHLCTGAQQLAPFTRAQECGIMGPLRELAMNGTERGKRKAVQLLEQMSRFLVQQQEGKEAQLQRHRHRPLGRRTGH